MIPTKTYPLSAIMGEELTDKERNADFLAKIAACARSMGLSVHELPDHCGGPSQLWCDFRGVGLRVYDPYTNAEQSQALQYRHRLACWPLYNGGWSVDSGRGRNIKTCADLRTAIADCAAQIQIEKERG